MSVVTDQQCCNSILEIRTGVVGANCSVDMGKFERNIGVFLYSRSARGIGSVIISGLVKPLFRKIEIPRTPRCLSVSKW